MVRVSKPSSRSSVATVCLRPWRRGSADFAFVLELTKEFEEARPEAGFGPEGCPREFAQRVMASCGGAASMIALSGPATGITTGTPRLDVRNRTVAPSYEVFGIFNNIALSEPGPPSDGERQFQMRR